MNDSDPQKLAKELTRLSEELSAARARLNEQNSEIQEKRERLTQRQEAIRSVIPLLTDLYTELTAPPRSPVNTESPTVSIAEPPTVEPEIPAVHMPDPTPVEPESPAFLVPEPPPTEPESPAVPVPEPPQVEPESPAVLVPEPPPVEPEGPAVLVPEPPPSPAGLGPSVSAQTISTPTPTQTRPSIPPASSWRQVLASVSIVLSLATLFYISTRLPSGPNLLPTGQSSRFAPVLSPAAGFVNQMRQRLDWLALPTAELFPRGISLPNREIRSSLLFVIYMSVILFWMVLSLFLYMALYRTYHRLRRRYRESRQAIFKKGIELVLMEEPEDRIYEALHPRRVFDLDIIQEVILDAMRHLKGPPFEALKKVSRRLGLIESNLSRLSSRNRHVRGRAIESLGLMQVKQASRSIIDAVHNEHLDLQLVAIRALAALKDPVALPHILAVSDTIPPTMLTRVASLMLEFGPMARTHIQSLINHHPKAFPPQVIAEMLQEMAIGMERPQ